MGVCWCGVCFVVFVCVFVLCLCLFVCVFVCFLFVCLFVCECCFFLISRNRTDERDMWKRFSIGVSRQVRVQAGTHTHLHTASRRATNYSRTCTHARTHTCTHTGRATMHLGARTRTRTHTLFHTHAPHTCISQSPPDTNNTQTHAHTYTHRPLLARLVIKSRCPVRVSVGWRCCR